MGLSLLKLSVKEIKNHKLKNIFFLIFLTIILFIGHVAINFSYNLDKYINDGINKDLAGRTLFVNSLDKDYKEVINDVMNYENIIYAYNVQDTFLNATITLNNNEQSIVNIDIKPFVTSYQPTIIKGRLPVSDNEMICSIYLKDREATTKDELEDMTKYLDKTITILYNKLIHVDLETIKVLETFKKDITIVGLFTNTVSTDSYNECYMKEELLSKMAEESKTEYSEEFLKEVYVSENGSGTKVIVDKVENTAKVANVLSENGYIVQPGYSIDYDSINTLKLIVNISLAILFIIMNIITIIYIKNLIKKDEKNIGIYKVLGYKNKYISRITLFQILIIIISSYLISFLLFFIGVLIANNIISNSLSYMFLSLKISILHEIIYLLFMLAFTIIISLVISSKIYKIEVKDILNENNN